MKHPSSYLKMHILGAIDYVDGKNISQRIKNIATQTFIDEDGNPRKFTWRTIQTWLYRYKSQGITGIQAKSRKDKGIPRKVTPEELLEALNVARQHFKDKKADRMSLYRHCISKGLLNKNQIAQTRNKLLFSLFLIEHVLIIPVFGNYLLKI